MRYGVILVFIGILIQGCPSGDQYAEEDHPNIIMILGDDHGYEYFGFMGSENVLTPNLDKLADGGVLFPQTHVTSSVCTPSLATLLTGLYPLQYDYLIMQEAHNTTSQKNLSMFDSASAAQIEERDSNYPITRFTTLPEYLADLGYVSFEGGKYWEGPYQLAGFTEGMTKSSGPEEIAQHGPIYAMAGGDGLTLGRESNKAVYEFINKHSNQPFYIWYAPMLPHTPHDPPQEFLDMYADRGLSEATQKYYANITRFDRRVGELVDFIDSSGLRENTLLFYLSDNGYEQNLRDKFHPMGQRRGKGSLHEMGFRTPLIFNWPGVIRPGRINSGLVSSVDLFPTILDFAGADLPADIPGESLKSSILQNSPTPRDTLYGSMNQIRLSPGDSATGTNPFANEEMSYYLTTNQWHFIHFEDRDSNALFDRIQDPEELNNLASGYPEMVSRFKEQITRWKSRQISDPE